MRTLLILFVISSVAFADDWPHYGTQYESQTALEKQNQLWVQVVSDTKNQDWFNPVQFAGIFLENMKTSLEWVGDTFEKGTFGVRNKYIHTVGSTAKVSFEARQNSEGYTGLFKGADSGLIRLSCAIQSDPKKSTSDGAYNNFVPGFGLKLLRNGRPSANLVAMFSVDGQKSWNFFANDFSNHIPATEGSGQKLLGKKFATATSLIQYVGLSDMAKYDQYGNQESNPVFPFQLIFEPNDQLRHKYPDDYAVPFQDQLSAVTVKSVLYKVYAKKQPTTDAVYIGDLVLDSQLTSSYFGDKYLFFRHQNMEEDIALRPEWKSHVTPASLSSGCPYHQTKGVVSETYQSVVQFFKGFF